MTPALLATTFAILALALAATSAGCVVLWARLRALGKAQQAREMAPAPTEVPPKAVGLRLDDLAGQHRALEWRVARVEASSPQASVAVAPHPGGPRTARRADPGHLAAPEAGPTLISVPSLSRAPAPPAEAAAELDRRFGGVWALADSGASAEAVARETGYPVGQVELILGLRRQLSAAAGAGPDA